MNIFQVFQSLTPANFQHQYLVLRHGQIVNATLLDMFPNGDAKISIQGQTVRAKLETPLAKGEHTFMQVKSFNDGTVNMQVITKNEKRAANTNVPISNINDLLKNMNLPQNSAWRELAQQLITRNIPLLPEILQNGIDVFGKEPTREQQQTWLAMLERALPINKATFQSVHQLLYGQPIHQLVQNFQAAANQFLKQHISTHVPSNMPSSIPTNNQQLPTNNQTINQQSFNIQTLISNNSQNLVQDNPLTTSTNRQQSAQVQELLTAVNSRTQAALVQQLIGINQPLTNQEPTTNNRPDNVQNLTIPQGNPQQTGTTLAGIRDIIRLQQMLETVQNSTNQAAYNSPQVTKTDTHILAAIFKLVGYQNENQLQSLFQNIQQPHEQQSQLANLQHSDNIKQLLLQISNSTSYPTAIRELASQMINNINGQQLLSTPQDSNTLYQSVMIQIPMSWGENQQDTLKLQIQGRKEKRTIDPDNCSIYIELTPPNLGELGIFIHIVNKVVSVKFLSEYQFLKQLTQQTEAILRAGLAEQGYKLSYIKVEPLDSISENSKNKQTITNYAQKPQTGFDIRI
ncbi:flagellar hook-length control protein FliK [Desulfuribacillus alkaliarsenatis]|uniref:Flagellar hook-length control protein-like C-terminal domain-containing protein n=1 Tax=Desulfuribacillus alkaliarsenatis TaxID=766136 RepID=A0A1E5G5X4_9FIRM|nr:flagellar hook-length control protein FliK [Desulfuribacillus alkaliarsenatis]OEF98576.1 hypothetical protein BHF68_02625 [Desulfuribacillus alkaliarsenatis]